MTKYFLLRLEYDGTDYFGWQIQRGTNQKTIQGELERCLKVLNPNGFKKSLGASRTDRGVHARDQICKVDLAYAISSKGLHKALNDLLPLAIRVKEVNECDESYHPIRDTYKKTYSYYFSPSDPRAFSSRYITKIHSTFSQDLLRHVCESVVGEWDFVNYFCQGSEVQTATRKIYSCTFRKSDREVGGFNEAGSVYVIEITGNGFLKQMVRLLVGAFLDVASGKLSIEDFKKSLIQKNEKRISCVMPAHGLFLDKIYDASQGVSS